MGPVSLKKVISIVPGDKSVTHRAVMFGSIAEGRSVFRTKVLGRDNFATIRIFQQLGVEISLYLTPFMFEMAKSERIDNCTLSDNETCSITIHGKGIDGLRESSSELDCGNSGTTARLLTGILASISFKSTLVGDHSLSKRPFKRVTEPLSEMGAKFSGDSLPLDIVGGNLMGKSFELKKASAQVKSAILLAGLFADGRTSVLEPVLSRDHTEKMLSAMGVDLEIGLDGDRAFVSVEGERGRRLNPIDIDVPGDISASMFYVVASLVAGGDEGVLIQGVGVNKTRSRCLEMLIEKGAEIEFKNEREVAGEPVADLLVRPSDLQPLCLDEAEVSKMIDEIPILAVLAAFTDGRSEIRGASELRVKESDRLAKTCAILKSFGVEYEEYEDGFVVEGKKGAQYSKDLVLVSNWKNTGDHRIEMCGVVMEYLAQGTVSEFEKEVVETSFPNFMDGFSGI